MDAPVSTAAGSTKMVRPSVLAVSTSVPALTAQSAVLHSVTTSCLRPLHRAPTQGWSGYPGSAASVWTATRAPGGSHPSTRFVHSRCFKHRNFLERFGVVNSALPIVVCRCPETLWAGACKLMEGAPEEFLFPPLSTITSHTAVTDLV